MRGCMKTVFLFDTGWEEVVTDLNNGALIEGLTFAAQIIPAGS